MIRLRLTFLAFVLLLGFIGVFFRAFQLQVFPTDKVAQLARRQLSRRIEIVGRRGGILDRNGRELAVSTNSLSIFANPKLIIEPNRIARALAPIIGVSESSLKTKLKEASDKHFIWLARQLSTRQMEQLEDVDLKQLKGIGVLPEFRREYPQGTLAAHVLGFSSIDGNGVEGVEKRFDDKLRGEKNLIELKRDALGRPLFTHSEQIRLDLNHGNDIDLTIDSNLQYTAERALREAVELNAAAGGTAIVMEPRTGEVLALANYPTFDPNAPSASSAASRRNRAITDPIEPGSVVKPFVVARALQDRIVKPDSMISGGDGFIKIGRKTIGEAEKGHRFKFVSIADLIRVSSNVATVILQQKMGWDRVEDTFRRLGFGSSTGIELSGESKGIFPATHASQLLERATMSFGQGIGVTPLQMAAAYSVIANGGFKIRPHIVKSEVDAKLPTERIFSEATSQKMRLIMEKVVEGEGTGVLARVESFSVAGKTGTSQRVDYKNGGYEAGAYWSSFAGFIPSRSPRFVIYVMIDRPSNQRYTGGFVAAPVFAKIARTALQLVPRSEIRATIPALTKISVPPTSSKSAGVPLATANLKIVTGSPGLLAPDVTGLPLSQALRVLEARGLDMEISGEGDRVVEQNPLAGEKLDSGRTLVLRLR